jgi:hypothetical protein
MTDAKQPADDEWRGKLEARLRRLPPPPVPAELEANLLARIPARRRPIRYRRPLVFRAVLALVGSGLIAAAMLVAALLFDGGRHGNSAGDSGTKAATDSSSRPPLSAATPPSTPLALRWAARQLDDPADPAGTTFDWPIETRATVPVGRAIVFELFD